MFFLTGVVCTANATTANPLTLPPTGSAKNIANDFQKAHGTPTFFLFTQSRSHLGPANSGLQKQRNVLTFGHSWWLGASAQQVSLHQGHSFCRKHWPPLHTQNNAKPESSNGQAGLRPTSSQCAEDYFYCRIGNHGASVVKQHGQKDKLCPHRGL